MNVRLTAKILGWVGGLATLVALIGPNLPQLYPDLPSHQIFKVVFPAPIKGVCEPIVTTGSFSNADFLAVRFTDAEHAVFVYDVWGIGGPLSQSFAVEPGITHTLELDLPTLATVRESKSHEQRLLRIVLDGRELLNTHAYFHRRAPDELYFAENPIGGTTADAHFRGQLSAADGVKLRGRPAPFLSLHGQVRELVHTRFGFLVVALLVSIAAGFLIFAATNWIAAHPPGRVAPRVIHGHDTAPHVWAAASILVCGAVFAALVTGGTFRFLVEDSFGTFYDHQAASLLRGHLDVPGEALSGEAFVVGGKIYGYFGITPALLRLPLVASGIAFGKLIRIFLLGNFVAALVAAYALLCHATGTLCGEGKWPSRWATVVFLASTGLGSTLLFLGSRAYIYHEAVLCGAMFTLWTIWFSLRWFAAPTSRNWIGALACGALAIHARPSSGLFALCLVGVVALHRARLGVKNQTAVRRPLAIGALAALAILSFNGLSYLKFGTFDGSPLRFSVQYTPERLARFDGKNFHVVNVPHNFDVYFVRPDFRLEPNFPYLFLGASQGAGYPGAKIDLAEPTLALPFAMPALFALAVIGGAWASLYAPAARTSLALLTLGVAPMAIALLTAIVTSHRYTGDFCPILIASAAWGLAVLDAEAIWIRRVALVLISMLAAVAIFVTGAISLFFQGDYVWGVPDEVKQNYQHLRDRADHFFGTAQRR